MRRILSFVSHKDAQSTNVFELKLKPSLVVCALCASLWLVLLVAYLPKEATMRS